MNDGSKDGTYAIMQQYAAKDKRIHIFMQENAGLTKTNAVFVIIEIIRLFCFFDKWRRRLQ